MKIEIIDEFAVRQFDVSGDYMGPDGNIKYDERSYDAITKDGAIEMARADGLLNVSPLIIETYLAENISQPRVVFIGSLNL